VAGQVGIDAVEVDGTPLAVAADRAVGAGAALGDIAAERVVDEFERAGGEIHPAAPSGTAVAADAAGAAGWTAGAAQGIVVAEGAVDDQNQRRVLSAGKEPAALGSAARSGSAVQVVRVGTAHAGSAPFCQIAVDGGGGEPERRRQSSKNVVDLQPAPLAGAA